MKLRLNDKRGGTLTIVTWKKTYLIAIPCQLPHSLLVMPRQKCQKSRYGAVNHPFQSNIYKERQMSEEHADRNERLKATMRQKETFLNKGPAQVPYGPPQAKNPPKNPSGHVDPYTGKKS
jgi:hypothetical protein